MTRAVVVVAFAAAAAGVLLVRRVATATGRAPAVTSAIQDFMAEVRVGMAEREAQLRTELGLDGRHDLVDAGL